MATKARTHDISLIDSHIKDVNTLCGILNQALSGAFPRAGRSRYSDVNVLLLSWENDDLGVTSELDELDEVFRDVYRYRTYQWRIPSNKSHNALVRRMMQALEKAESVDASVDELLVVYYGGHGYMNEDRQCVWLCNQQPNAATLQWSSIQTMLEEADSDVLILLDCCAAASSAGGSGKGIIELIAACGFEAFAPGVGEHSFTRSLVEELRYYGQRPGPISTAFLHNKVLSRAKKSWNPRYVRDGTHERRRTPIHIHLADRSKQRCIELTPLPTPTIPAPSQTTSNAPSSTPSTSPPEDVDMSDPNNSSMSSLGEVWPDPQYTSPKVLISIALEEDQIFRVEGWIDWLKSVPALAACVHIESAYKSDSTLLLVSLPVAIWDLLPRDPAISFISFVKSENMVHTEGPTMQSFNLTKARLSEKRTVNEYGLNEYGPSEAIDDPTPPCSNNPSMLSSSVTEPSGQHPHESFYMPQRRRGGETMPEPAHEGRGQKSLPTFHQFLLGASAETFVPEPLQVQQQPIGEAVTSASQGNVPLASLVNMTLFFSANMTLLMKVIEQERELFWRDNAGLSEEVRQQRWAEQISQTRRLLRPKKNRKCISNPQTGPNVAPELAAQNPEIVLDRKTTSVSGALVPRLAVSGIYPHSPPSRKRHRDHSPLLYLKTYYNPACTDRSILGTD